MLRKPKPKPDDRWVVNDLKDDKDLQLPVLEFEDIKQPDVEFFADIYARDYSYRPPKDEDWTENRYLRDKLQFQITDRLKKIEKILTPFDLTSAPSFYMCYDQSDYKNRMKLITGIIESRFWDLGTFKNDDVYREK